MRYLLLVLITIIMTNFALAKMPQLMSEQKQQHLRSLIPKVDDERINTVVNSDIMLYTRKEMPNVYWQNGAFRDARYDIGPANAPKPHNGARDFPWNDPGGTHRCGDEVDSFKWMALPQNKNGEFKKVLWFKEPVYNYSRGPGGFEPYEVSGHTVAWIFPPGTVFGEVLTITGPDGKDRPFEMRVRRRMSNGWAVDVFRPFPTVEDFLSVIPNENDVYKHLTQEGNLERGRLVDSEHPHSKAIDVEAEIDVLPPIPHYSVSYLLENTVFKSCLGKSWRGEASAPTTNTDYHIVPKNYDGTFVGTDRTSCINCHESTGKHVQLFSFGRDWYGLIRGSDRILSWHPIDPSCVVKDASAGQIRFRKEFGSILEKYNTRKHVEYSRLSK